MRGTRGGGGEMRKTRLSIWRAVVAVGTAAVVAALAVAAQATPRTPAHAARAAEGTVKMAVGPYLDYMPWLVAHQLGIDKQFGLDISATTLQTPQLAGPQLRRGDLDVAYSCQACNFAILKQIPELRDWMITNQFKGFAVIGRKG